VTGDAIARSDAIHARLGEVISRFDAAVRAGERAPGLGAEFDEIAIKIATLQFDAQPGYARLCAARGAPPSESADANALPAVPTDAFKLTRVASFAEGAATATFLTSGTTVGARGEHAFRRLDTYRAAALATARAWLLPGVTPPLQVAVLAPPPEQAPESSLGYMCARFVEAFGDGAPADATWLVSDGVIDLRGFDERVSRGLTTGTPTLLMGASFAFVHLLDALGDDSFALPPGSRVMTTGGFKGKSREVDGAALRADIARALRVDPRAVVSEYGMTELSSQFYERTLAEPTCAAGVHAEPPWARVVPVDPDTLEPVPDGAVGIAKIIDLLNVDSAVAVLTQDRVRRVPGGFEILGRLPGAPPRGCSLAIDELLGRA
jgi:hypothetical protein